MQPISSTPFLFTMTTLCLFISIRSMDDAGCIVRTLWEWGGCVAHLHTMGGVVRVCVYVSQSSNGWEIQVAGKDLFAINGSLQNCWYQI